ncbi:MAG: DUF4388 domain-containing protein [Actinomycetes bacterium]
MALQGTIETFPVIDVVTLLAASGHSGRLVVDGDRGATELWVDDGDLVGGAVEGRQALDGVSLVVEALRNRSGEFVFETSSGAVVAPDGVHTPRRSLRDLVAEAEQRLVEWRSIEEIVPTMSHRLRLSSALAADSVTLDQSQWALIVAASRLPAVSDAASELVMDDLTACRLVVDLVTTGVMAIEAPAIALNSDGVEPTMESVTWTSASTGLPAVEVAETSAPSHEFDVPTVSWEAPAEALVADFVDDLDVDEPNISSAEFSSTPDAVDVESGSVHGFPDHFPIDDLIGSGPDDDWDDMGESAPPTAADPLGASVPAFAPMEPAVEAGGPVFAGLPEVAADAADQIWEHSVPTAPVDEAELRRQMAQLSPKAAEAIAAALETLPDDSNF